MSNYDFVSYAGDPDFHDGQIERVEENGTVVWVTLAGYSGRRYLCEFQNVKALDAHEPEGMMIYALSHWRDRKGDNWYDFANWKWEEDDAKLKVQATDFSIGILDEDGT